MMDANNCVLSRNLPSLIIRQKFAYGIVFYRLPKFIFCSLVCLPYLR